MKASKKINRRYDRRQAGYEATMKSLSPSERAGFRRPGSKNPRKAGGK